MFPINVIEAKLARLPLSLRYLIEIIKFVGYFSSAMIGNLFCMPSVCKTYYVSNATHVIKYCK